MVHEKKQEKNKEKLRMFFIDLSNAYDSIERTKLYEILRKKQILNNEEIQLIKFIHSNLTLTIGKEKTKTTTGVPQGMKSSPMLFNIFIE